MAAIGGTSRDEFFDLSVGNIAQLLEGNDTFIGSEGTETVNAGPGNDNVSGRGGNDVLVGEDGDDALIGDEDDDTIDAGTGRDVAQGSNGNDYISGGNDEDLLFGENGDDRIRGNAGADAISGGLGNDTLAGEEDSDQVFGDAGNDVITGGAGNDTLTGSEGDDFVSGEEGDDELNGGTGSDNVDGGDGNDLLRGDRDDAPVPIDLGTQVPQPKLEQALSELFGNDFLRGGNGNDTAVGAAGNDVISGDDGDDQIFGNQGNDFITGGDGIDTIHGGQNNDQIYGNAGNDLLYADNGDDVVYGGQGNDAIYGNQGVDILNGNLGDDTVYGGQGNDTVRGGQGNDQTFGDLGDDTLYGDVGADTLTGGAGRDVFSIAQGRGGGAIAQADVITDFQNEQDVIELAAPLLFENLSIFQGTDQNASNTIVQDALTGEFLLVLQNVSVNLIDRTDFIPGPQAPPPVVNITPPPPPPAANAGTLEFTQAEYQYNENGVPVGVEVNVTRTGGSEGAVSVTLTLSNGTANATLGGATSGEDFTATPITVSFAEGDEAPQKVTIPILDDELQESDEVFNLALSNVTGGATIGEQATATVTILDNDNPGVVDFSAATFTGTEANGTAEVTVRRSGGSDGELTATIQLANGTATGGPQPFPADGTVDFDNTLSTTVTFAAGETGDKIVNIPINNDTATEGTETVSLTLTGANVGTTNPTATLNIEDDDVPTVRIDTATSDLEASEQGPSTGALAIVNDGTSPVVVKYAIAGTAKITGADTDFTIASSNPGDPVGQITVPGNGTATLTVTPIDSPTDGGSEGNETVKITLDPAGGLYRVGDAGEAEVTILDNDVPIVEITASDATATEAGATTATFTVRRKDGNNNPVTTGALTVNYSVGGSAVSGSDFDPLTGSIVIPDGTDSATFNLTPVDDATVELDESAIATLSASTTYSIDTARERATAIITDNEATKVIILPNDGRAAEADLDPGQFLIQRLGDKTNPITVNYALDLTTSTATQGVDFVALSGSVTIAAGQNNAPLIAITPINDAGAEPEPVYDTVTLNLIEPTNAVASGYSLGSPTSGTVFILNNGT